MNKQPTEQKAQVRFPGDLWAEIKKLAQAEERSVNGEIVWILKDYVSRRAMEVKQAQEGSLPVRPGVQPAQAQENLLDAARRA